MPYFKIFLVFFFFFQQKILVYKIDQNQSFIHEKFGLWTVDNGLIDLRETRIISRRRRDLRGKALKATVVLLHKDSIHQLTDLR